MSTFNTTLTQAREAMETVVSYVQHPGNKIPTEVFFRAVQLQLDLGNHREPTHNKQPPEVFQLPDPAGIEEEDIIHALQRGWDLSNRGTGWWLTQPRVAYQSPKKYSIGDVVVESLRQKKLITTQIPYVTAVAILTDEGRALP